MYDLDPITLDDGSLAWAILSGGRILRVHRHYDDAVKHFRRLCNARMRKVRAGGAA
jgi:hypothetical protein